MMPPPAHGSKAIPEGQPNCLAGLAFVFTGELSSFSRDEASDIAKRYGGFAWHLFNLSNADVLIQARNASTIE